MTTAWPRPKPSSAWEAETRSLVHRAGLRFQTRRLVMHGLRSNGQGAYCTPDLTFMGPRVAVFLDGCYWHGCPTHHPDKFKPYDAVIDCGLTTRGWRVLHIRECTGPLFAAAEVLRHVKGLS